MTQRLWSILVEAQKNRPIRCGGRPGLSRCGLGKELGYRLRVTFRLVVRLVAVFFLVDRFAVDFLAVVFRFGDFFLAVVFFLVDRFAVDFLAEVFRFGDFLAVVFFFVDRLGAAFLLTARFLGAALVFFAISMAPR